MTQTQITPGNWLNWSHFFAHGIEEAQEQTHYLWEYGNNVNSPILTESNGAQIKKRLERVGADFEMTTNKGALRGTRTYAVFVRIADDSGQPIENVVAELQAIKKDLDDYPILDDEDYSQRAEEANHQSLVAELRLNSADWDYPDDDYEQLAWNILDITQERESHDESWFPDFDGAVGAALVRLGFTEE